MSNWKAKIGWKDKKYLYLALIALTGMTIYQQVLITDLQTRMMNIEASRYDDQLNDIRWEAEKALEENKEQQKDILHLQNTAQKTVSILWKCSGICTAREINKIPRQTAWQDAGNFYFQSRGKVLNGAV